MIFRHSYCHINGKNGANGICVLVSLIDHIKSKNQNIAKKQVFFYISIQAGNIDVEHEGENISYCNAY